MKWMIVLTFFTAYMAVATCRGGSRRRSGRCQSSSDCADDECCLARNTVQLVGIGRCRRLSSFGELCTPEDQAVETYGGKYVRSCPCRSGLICESDGRGRQPFLRNRCFRGTTSSTSTTTSTTSAPTTTSTATTPTTTSLTTPTTTASTTSSTENPQNK